MYCAKLRPVAFLTVRTEGSATGLMAALSLPVHDCGWSTYVAAAEAKARSKNVCDPGQREIFVRLRITKMQSCAKQVHHFGRSRKILDRLRQILLIGHTITFRRPFVKRFACYRTVVLSDLSVLSVTLMYCCQTVGWIKMKLGIE